MAKSQRKQKQIEDNLKLDVIEKAKNETDVWEKQKRVVAPKTLTNVKLTPKQAELIKLMDANNIITISGPAGSSKTFIECYYAIKCLKDKTIDRIILTKPIQEAGEKLGALPGTVEEKIDPHYESFRQNMLNFIPKPEFDKLVKNGNIECKPLAYLRGTGFKKCLSGDTKIELSNGSFMGLKELMTLMVDFDKKFFVKSYNFKTNAIEEKELNGIERSPTPKNNMYKIEFDDGSTIVVTGNHRFYTNTNTEITVNELKNGDTILSNSKKD